MKPTWRSPCGRAELWLGDCRDAMAAMDAESVDSIVCDPPYGLSFMGKDWDRGVPGVVFWQEALRVAKPGAHLLAFGGTRTFHRLTCAIEDAGWEIRDCVMWVYGSGFPKSLDVSKAMDKAAGAERKVIGKRRFANGTEARDGAVMGQHGRYGSAAGNPLVTAPATDTAIQWQGWGTALKPAWEPIIVARKPLAGTVAANVQRFGTGAVNVDGCRIEGGKASGSGQPPLRMGGENSRPFHEHAPPREFDQSTGRWPANVIHDGSAEVLALMPETASGVMRGGTRRAAQDAPGSVVYGTYGGNATALDTPGDSGSAARFFYCAKASKEDRDGGLEIAAVPCGLMEDDNYDMKTGSGKSRNTCRRNHHPTVKPTDLMRYLCRLVTPPHGRVLDPFSGSGSTGKAAIREGFDFIGIELDEHFIDIARRRIEAELAQPDMFVEHARAEAEQPDMLA